MYRYEYETVEFRLGGWKLGNGIVYEIDNYREIIARRAKDGWRYAGNIPTKQLSNTGHVQALDLIFEKEV